MVKYIFPFIIILCVYSSCTKEPITIDDLIIELEVTPEVIYADTKTKIKVTAVLNEKLDKRNVIFKTNSGVFSKNSESKIIVEATFIDSVLSASTWIEPLASATELIVSAQIELTDLEDAYIKSQTIKILESEPESITITANSFDVMNDFDGEIEITGILYNVDGNGVSRGTSVLFKDYDSDFNQLQGHYRNNSLTSNSSSQVSTIYTPGLIESNQFINIVAVVLDANQNETAIQDTVQIYINQKD